MCRLRRLGVLVFLAAPLALGACRERKPRPRPDAAPVTAPAAAPAAPSADAGRLPPPEGAPPPADAGTGRNPGNTPAGELQPPPAEGAPRSSQTWAQRCSARIPPDELSAFSCPRLAPAVMGPRYRGLIQAVTEAKSERCDEIFATPYDERADARRAGCKLAVGVISVARKKDPTFCNQLDPRAAKRFQGTGTDAEICLELHAAATAGLNKASARKVAQRLFGDDRTDLAVAAILGDPSLCATLRGIDERITCLAMTGGLTVADLSTPASVLRLIDGTTFFE